MCTQQILVNIALMCNKLCKILPLSDIFCKRQEKTSTNFVADVMNLENFYA